MKALAWLCADMLLNPTTPWWQFWKSVAALQAFMMSLRGSVIPSLNRASRRKGAAMNADVNMRVCTVASWTATVVVGMAVAATAAAAVVFKAMTVAVIAVPAVFTAPAGTTVGGAVPPAALVEGVLPDAATGVLVVVGPCLLFLLEARVMPAVRPVIVAAWGAVEPVTDEAAAACGTIVPAAGVVLAVRPAVVAAWSAIEPVVVEAVVACRDIVPPVANPLLARATSSSIDLQLAILVAAGMVTVKEVTAAP